MSASCRKRSLADSSRADSPRAAELEALRRENAELRAHLEASQRALQQHGIAADHEQRHGPAVASGAKRPRLIPPAAAAAAEPYVIDLAESDSEASITSALPSETEETEGVSDAEDDQPAAAAADPPAPTSDPDWDPAVNASPPSPAAASPPARGRVRDRVGAPRRRRVRGRGAVAVASTYSDFSAFPSAVLTEQLEVPSSGDEEEDAAAAAAQDAELFARYAPAKIRVARLAGDAPTAPGIALTPHPTRLIEPLSLKAVAPPDPVYAPALPAALFTTSPAQLSDAQFEAIVYAGQRHAELLPSGQRAGFLMGDGAGVGKGREIAAIVLDNYRRGRKRSVWVSVNKDLFWDAKRDLSALVIGDDDAPPFARLRDLNLKRASTEERDAAAAAKNEVMSRISGEEHGLPASDDEASGGGLESAGASGAAVVRHSGADALIAVQCDAVADGLRATGISSNGDAIVFTTYAMLRRPHMLIPLAAWLSHADNEGAASERGGDGSDGSSAASAARSTPSISGVLAFDEIHLAKNSRAVDGKMGGAEGVSQQGEAVEVFQALCPDVRVVYASATGATEPRNLACMPRLGLWGATTPFEHFPDFCAAIGPSHSQRGATVGKMEMVAMELKAAGAYCCRMLSWAGSSFKHVHIEPTAAQRTTYDGASAMWCALLATFRRDWAMEFAMTKRLKAKGTKHSSRVAVSKAQFWSAHQRFFKQMLVAFKVPQTVRIARRALEHNRCPVISLWSTGEATTRHAEKRHAAKKDAIEGMVSAPRETVMRLVATQLFHLTAAERAALNARLERLDLPLNPIDEIVRELGGYAAVSELSGRTCVLVEVPPEQEKDASEELHAVGGLDSDADGASSDGGAGGSAVWRVVARRVATRSEATNSALNLEQWQAFMAGTKRVAVVTKAASTGISLHSGRTYPNMRRREMITLELPWAADNAVQQLGRVHRANQRVPPRYNLISTSLGGERRFLAQIAQRLATLGALTKGDRRAAVGSAGAGAGFGSANFMDQYGHVALQRLWSAVFRPHERRRHDGDPDEGGGDELLTLECWRRAIELTPLPVDIAEPSAGWGAAAAAAGGMAVAPAATAAASQIDALVRSLDVANEQDGEDSLGAVARWMLEVGLEPKDVQPKDAYVDATDRAATARGNKGGGAKGAGAFGAIAEQGGGSRKSIRKTKSKFVKFANRLLGMTCFHQARVFAFFHELYLDEVRHAQSEGRFNPGVVSIPSLMPNGIREMARRGSPMTLRKDPRTGARTMLVSLRVNHGLGYDVARSMYEKSRSTLLRSTTRTRRRRAERAARRRRRNAAAAARGGADDGAMAVAGDHDGEDDIDGDESSDGDVDHSGDLAGFIVPDDAALEYESDAGDGPPRGGVAGGAASAADVNSRAEDEMSRKRRALEMLMLANVSKPMGAFNGFYRWTPRAGMRCRPEYVLLIEKRNTSLLSASQRRRHGKMDWITARNKLKLRELRLFFPHRRERNFWPVVMGKEKGRLNIFHILTTDRLTRVDCTTRSERFARGVLIGAVAQRRRRANGAAAAGVALMPLSLPPLLSSPDSALRHIVPFLARVSAQDYLPLHFMRILLTI